MNAPRSSRGIAVGNFDNDSVVGIIIMNIKEPPSLLKQDVSGANQWLKVMLVGVTSNERHRCNRDSLPRGKKRARPVLARSRHVYQ